MPTFSYKETRGKVFDVRKTETTVGVLPEYFRKQRGVKRSLHPIFSFAASGKNAEKFVKLENFDCFGAKSIFGKLYDANAAYISFGIDMQNSSTYIIFSEQKRKVPYKKFKTFREVIVDENGKKLTKTVKYFARDLTLGYRAQWHDLEKAALSGGVVKSFAFNGGTILRLKSREIDTLIGKELKRNKNFLIRKI